MKSRAPKKAAASKRAETATPSAGENKYQVGDLVNERVHPYRKFKIISYSHRIYQCQLLAHPEQECLALTEREIMLTK